MVALLGRRDQPTDAVQEYCQYLGSALHARGGDEIEIARVPWTEMGWAAALRELRQQAVAWQGEWVLVQYTALGWSGRGFPWRLVRVLEILRDAGARVAVIFHDVEPYSGRRLVDRLRRASQLRTMRGALILADIGIFTVALHAISWLGAPPSNARFIPVGANLLPQPSASENFSANREHGLCVSVFGITGGLTGERECRQIVAAMSFAAEKLGRVRLHAFGRGVIECEGELRDGLRGTAVDVSIDGVLPVERVAEALSAADVMLFVREPISSRRGSAIAGISCGLPVICYGGKQTAEPVTEAGIVLVSSGNIEELGDALVRVLGDDKYRARLASRSRVAYREHFSWGAIAARYLAVLGELT